MTNKELIRYNDYRNGWNISHKYAKILLNHLDKLDINKIETIYGNFISELKSNSLDYKKKRYFVCWETMIKTYKNIHKLEIINKSKINFCVKQLHYITFLNI